MGAASGLQGGGAAAHRAPSPPSAGQTPHYVEPPKARVAQPSTEKQTLSTAKTTGQGGAPVPRADPSAGLAEQRPWTARCSRATQETGLCPPSLGPAGPKGPSSQGGGHTSSSVHPHLFMLGF